MGRPPVTGLLEKAHLAVGWAAVGAFLRFTSEFVKNLAPRRRPRPFHRPAQGLEPPPARARARRAAVPADNRSDAKGSPMLAAALRLSLLAAAMTLALADAASAQDGSAQDGAADDRVAIELNRLEPREGGCQAYIVTRNPGDVRHESLRLDVVLFDRDGVVARRMAVQAGPVPPQKTSVRVFAIDGVACEDAGALLLNDVLDCAQGQACLDAVAVSARPPLQFIR
jgi:hypothetical protein